MARSNKGPLGKGLGALVGASNKTESGIVQVDIEKIDPNPYQPRTTFAEDALITLMESIRRYGLVQPIVVRRLDERYQLVAGERRWRACQALDMKEIPAIVKNYSTEETTEIALVENLQRQDLDPIEEAYAYFKLSETFKVTQEEIATKVGRSRSHVANMLRLLKLPVFLQNELSVGDLTIGQARPLLTLKSEAKQQEALQLIHEKDLNARQIEALVKKLNNESAKKQTPEKNDNAEIRLLVERLKLSLGTSVDIKLRSKKNVKGTIEIAFSSETELTRLIQQLEEEKNSQNINADSRKSLNFTV